MDISATGKGIFPPRSLPLVPYITVFPSQLDFAKNMFWLCYPFQHPPPPTLTPSVHCYKGTIWGESFVFRL